MSEQFFCLKPETELYQFIKNCKKLAYDIAGDQKYLQDDPHLTLYVGEFDCGTKTVEEFDKVFQFNNMEIELNGWHVFYNDPVTGGNTLIIEVSGRSLKELKKIQQIVVETASPHRKTAVIERYRNSSNYSESMKSSLDSYGFPFVGEIWKAHFTIASFEKDIFEEVYKVLSKEKVPELSSISSLHFNHILENSFQEIAKWEFK